jgi:hypothetical protein
MKRSAATMEEGSENPKKSDPEIEKLWEGYPLNIYKPVSKTPLEMVMHPT